MTMHDAGFARFSDGETLIKIPEHYEPINVTCLRCEIQFEATFRKACDSCLEELAAWTKERQFIIITFKIGRILEDLSDKLIKWIRDRETTEQSQNTTEFPTKSVSQPEPHGQ